MVKRLKSGGQQVVAFLLASSPPFLPSVWHRHLCSFLWLCPYNARLSTPAAPPLDAGPGASTPLLPQILTKRPGPMLCSWRTLCLALYSGNS